MGTPPLSQSVIDETFARVEAELRAGFRPYGMTGSGNGAIAEAGRKAVADGFIQTIAAFEGRVTRLRQMGAEPEWELYRPRQYQHRSPGAPAIPDQSFLSQFDIEGEPEEVIVIGDSHDAPHLRDKSRFEWIGKFAADTGVKRVHSTGDWWTMDSFSTHTDRATWEGFAKPTFDQDRESFHESQQAFQRGLGSHKVKKTCTLGNHEVRAARYSNSHPDGLNYMDLVEEAFMQWGWRTVPYGEWMFINGVGFVHVPFNRMGRSLTKSQRPNKVMCDVIHGDDHEFTVTTDFKSGPFRSPTVYSAATSLPPWFIEGYTNKGGATWRSGVCKATIWGGYVMEWQFIDMCLLRRRYGAEMVA